MGVHESWFSSAAQLVTQTPVGLYVPLLEFDQHQREVREYDNFLHQKVKGARLSMRAGQGQSNDEIEAEFAARRASAAKDV